MKVVLAEEMNIIDKKNIMEIGIPGIVLMENAAKNIITDSSRNSETSTVLCRR